MLTQVRKSADRMQLHASLYSEGYKVSTSHDPIAEVMFCLKYCIHIVGGLPPHGYTNTEYMDTR